MKLNALDLGRFRIGTKVFLLVGLLAAVVMIVAGSGTLALHRVGGATKSLQETTDEIRLGAELQRNVIELSRSEYEVALDTARVEEMRGYVEEREEAFEGRLQRLRTSMNEVEQAVLDEVESAYDTYLADLRLTFDAAEANSDGHKAILSQIEDNRLDAQDLTEEIEALVSLTEAHSTEAAEDASDISRTAQFTMMGVAAVGVLGGVALGLLLSQRGIVSPLRRCVSALKQLADGKLDVEVFGAGRQDEVGDIAQTMEVFRDNAIAAEEQKRAREAAEERAEEEQRQAMLKLADRFESEIGEVVETVGAASEELNSTAQSMSAVSEETSHQAQAVSAASLQASQNVETVASAAEELSASITEINGQVSQTTQRAQSARTEAEQANEQVTALAEASDKISDVVQLIEDIAERTNLLALNATIESARAGEAGKGFAVVASEVKSLAQQTTEATTEISERIERVQQETRQGVEAIAQISERIKEIDESSTSIASAVEQQSAATNEITRNVTEASNGTQEVNKNITSVSEAATEAGSASEQVVASGGQLSEQAGQLRQKVKAFLEEVRAA